MAIKIVFANHKGGVGKTVTTINTAYGLAKRGKKVLVVDCDPQGNCTMTLSKKPPFEFDEEETLKHLFTSDEIVSFSSLAKPTDYENLFFVPNNVDIYPALSALRPNSIKRFYGFVQAYKQDPDAFDYILFDTPPTLEGTLTTNAFVLTDYMVIPIEAESSYALSGISNLVSTFLAIRREAQTNSKILGYLLTRYDGRRTAAKAIEQAAIEVYGRKQIFEGGIPTATIINKAIMESVPICEKDPEHTACKAYSKFVSQLLKRIEEDRAGD